MLDFDLLDEAEGLQDHNLPEAIVAPVVAAEAAPTYWWEDGYKVPLQVRKPDETERAWNSRSKRYEDQPRSQRLQKLKEVRGEKGNASSSGSDVDIGVGHEIATEQVTALDDLLAQLDVDETLTQDVEDSLVQDLGSQPVLDYHERPVPKRVWNPQSSTFEVVTTGESMFMTNGGWIAKNDAQLVVAPMESMEQVLKRLEAEETAPVKQDHEQREPTSGARVLPDELPTTAEPLPWSRTLGQAPPSIETMQANYAPREVEVAALREEGRQERHVERAKEIEIKKRKNQQRAIEEATRESLNRIDLGELPVEKERLPGMRERPRSGAASSSSSSRPKTFKTHSEALRPGMFSMLPGMMLPDDALQVSEPSSSSSVCCPVPQATSEHPPAEATAAPHVQAGYPGEAPIGLPKDAGFLVGSKHVRPQRRENRRALEEVDEDFASLGLQSIKPAQAKVAMVPDFKELLARLDQELDGQA